MIVEEVGGMGVKVQVIKNIYYLAITHNGHRHYESLHMKRSGTRMDREMDRLAEMCRAKREMQLVSSDFDLSDSTGSKMKLYDFLNALANGDVHNQYTRCLRYIEDYPEGTTIRLRDVTTEWLAKFQSYLLGKELMPSTVRLYMNLLKSAFNQAVKERKLVSNPTRGLPTIKVPQTLKDILTIEDIRKLDATPINGVLGAEVRRAFLFACFTGLRISDIRELRWHNIDGDRLRIVMHKTQRALEIPIHDNAKKYLEQNDSEYVFPLIAQSTTNCIIYLSKWAINAGVDKKIGWHTARRSFATIAVSVGIDQYVISKLLGHASIQHTSIYSQVSMPTKKEAVDKIPSI